ncbi:unnamed protein product [Clavelina lepadiformis]|uniref:Uncharacterized protein n=1 Tax=Clavelina lepadiformis TaxID=159417 RepID=A0ABP0H009_CLALP
MTSTDNANTPISATNGNISCTGGGQRTHFPNVTTSWVNRSAPGCRDQTHVCPDRAIYLTLFFLSNCSNLLNIVYSDKNDFTDLASIQTVIIDNYGWYFDVEV